MTKIAAVITDNINNKILIILHIRVGLYTVIFPRANRV